MLVNVETAFTMVVAVTVLREHAGRLEVACVLGIVAGAFTLSTNLGVGLNAGHLAGNVFIVVATAAWAFDNNISTGLARRHSPAAVAAWKNLVGAGLVVAAAALMGAELTRVGSALPGLLLAGGLGTGVSLTLFYLALRHIGAYRTSAIFGLGGVFGAAAAYAFLGERLSLVQVAGAATMVAAGLALALSHRANDKGQKPARGADDPREPGEPAP
jgi:drug/metabolite transporter (DMT)-like permease